MHQALLGFGRNANARQIREILLGLRVGHIRTQTQTALLALADSIDCRMERLAFRLAEW